MVDCTSERPKSSGKSTTAVAAGGTIEVASSSRVPFDATPTRLKYEYKTSIVCGLSATTVT
jgi:hypothetical protein